MVQREWILLYHTLLIGASPLIPIPFLDEFIVRYLRRHLVAEIAKNHDTTLSKTEIRQLADGQANGCSGLLSFIIILPLKEIFREIFFWLEWKRGIALATQAYYFGYLLNVTFERRELNSTNVKLYRQAIESSLIGTNTTLVQGVIKQTFRSSRGLVRGVTSWLFQFGKYYLKLTSMLAVQRARRLLGMFRKKKAIEPSEQNSYDLKLDAFLEEPQPHVKDLIETMLESLSSGIGGLPKEHFEDLVRKFNAWMDYYSDPTYLSAVAGARNQHSRLGIASFIFSLLAVLAVLMMYAIFFSQSYWSVSGLDSLFSFQLPCLTFIPLLIGVILGLSSLSKTDRKNTYGVIGLLLGALTALSCCILFGLDFVYRSGLGR